MRTPTSAAVLTVLLLAACARQPTGVAAASSPPIASLAPGSSAASTAPASPLSSPPASEPASSSLALNPAVTSAPTSGPPDPCLAPVVEKAAAVPVPNPGADSLRVCHPGAVPGRAGSVALSGNDATNIGKLLDLAPEGTATCSYKPDVLLRFEFRGAPKEDEDVEVSSVGCDHPTASVEGRTWLISPTLADFLSADAIAPGAKGNPPPVPNVTGLSLAEASDIITRAGMTIYPSDRVTDPLLSPDTVVLQDPPAGAGMIGSGTEVDVLLSQQPAPACSAAQLAFDYHGVQYGTGDAFSDLDVRDTGATPCTLTGPISVVGVDIGGHAVTNHLSFSVARDLVLTARASARAPGSGAPNNAVIAWVPLEANVRDGPDAGGSCARHLVVPNTWLVTLADGVKSAPNGDGAAEPPMSACEGKLDVPINPSPITPLG